MSEAAPDTAALPRDGQEHRLHPLSLLFVLLAQLKQFILPLLVLLFAGRGDRNDLWGLLAMAGLVVLMDIRHPLKDYDRSMIGYAMRRGLPAHALLTKADKLSRGAAMNTVQAVRKDLSATYCDSVSVQGFSGETRQGVDELRAVVAGWL